MHSLKFAASLQAHTTGDSPILLRVEEAGGHGLGNAARLTVEELSDIYTFLFNLLDTG